MEEVLHSTLFLEEATGEKQFQMAAHFVVLSENKL